MPSCALSRPTCCGNPRRRGNSTRLASLVSKGREVTRNGNAKKQSRESLKSSPADGFETSRPQRPRPQESSVCSTSERKRLLLKRNKKGDGEREKERGAGFHRERVVDTADGRGSSVASTRATSHRSAIRKPRESVTIRYFERAILVACPCQRLIPISDVGTPLCRR